MSAKLYALALGIPSQAVRLMLELKGIDHEVKDLLPGFHPPQLRLAGFRGDTGRYSRSTGGACKARAISRTLDEIQPNPPLFPASRAQARGRGSRGLGEREFQPVPRRIFPLEHDAQSELRRWMAKPIGMPAPGLAATMNLPIGSTYPPKAGAGDERTRTSRTCPPSSTMSMR